MTNNILKSTIQATLNSIINTIDKDASEFNMEIWKKCKSKFSGAKIAEELGISVPMLTEFEETLKQYYTSQDNIDKERLGCLRISLWLETISKNVNIPFAFDLALTTEETAIKQVRALELIIRDVITEQLGGTDNVIVKLKDLFKQDVIDKWIKSADNSGILSGTTFSELSNILLDKNIFQGIEEIFKSSNLELTKSTRDSLRYILEDIRIIRNSIAHNKKVSNIQIEALNEYYKSISTIIKNAQKTKVDPDTYLDLTKLNMEEFISTIKQDNQIISGNLETIKEVVVDIKSDTSSIKKRNTYVIIGVLILLLFSTLIFYYQYNQSSDIKDIKIMVSSDLKDIDNRISEIENKISKGSKVNSPKNLEDYLINASISYATSDFKETELMLEKIFKEGYIKYDLVSMYYEVLFNNYNGDTERINQKIDGSYLKSDNLIRQLVELDYNNSGINYYIKLEKFKIQDSVLRAFMENNKAKTFYVDSQKYPEMTDLIKFWSPKMSQNEKLLGVRLIKAKPLFFSYNNAYKKYLLNTSYTNDENAIWRFYNQQNGYTAENDEERKSVANIWLKMVNKK